MGSKFGIDARLTDLNTKMIEMGSKLEEAINKSVKALLKYDEAVADEAIKLEKRIDKKEDEIVNFCYKIMLEQSPVASDLRKVQAAIKMASDMERIGDQARDISELTKYLAEEKFDKQKELFTEMANETKKMVSTAIDAYVKQDLSIASAVIENDDVVDDIFTRIKEQICELIETDKTITRLALDCLLIAKYFERIGDHATNIGELVIYSVKGTSTKKEIQELAKEIAEDLEEVRAKQ